MNNIKTPSDRNNIDSKSTTYNNRATELLMYLLKGYKNCQSRSNRNLTVYIFIPLQVIPVR